MQCYVYRSSRRADTYVYLLADNAGESLPEAMRQMLGPLDRVMALVLSPERKLAREDVAVVMANLRASGFHVQFPPQLHALQ